MDGALPKLFRYSWGFAAATLGVLASTMALVALVFRRIGRDAVNATGFCAPPVPDGGEVYCTLGVALANVAGWLNVGAIVVAACAFVATWNWWQRPHGSDTSDRGEP